MSDPSDPSGSQGTVCAVCTPEGLECARIRLELNTKLTLHEAYTAIASGESGDGPTMFQRSTRRLYNEQDQATFGALAAENHAQMSALLDEYRDAGCDPDAVLEHRRAVHDWQPPAPEGVMEAGRWAAEKGVSWAVRRVPLLGGLAGDFVDGVEEVYEQHAIPF